MDHTWFDAPEERDRARRAKLDMYVSLSSYRVGMPGLVCIQKI